MMVSFEWAKMVRLRLNPAIDPIPFARMYAETSIVQVHSIFEPEVADYIERMLASLPWRILCQDDNEKNLVLTSAEMAAMTPDARKNLLTGIADRARRAIGYTYFTYPMIFAALNAWDPDHPIHDLTEFLNSSEMLNFARTIIGCPAVTKIDAHASNYQRGHYLTRHVDDGEEKERRAAYTLGFSRDWQIDWGGLLLFMDQNGDVRRGLLPRFNVLTVFDGLMVHSVSPVSSFTTASRLSIAGWFRDDPPAGTPRP